MLWMPSVRAVSWTPVFLLMTVGSVGRGQPLECPLNHWARDFASRAARSGPAASREWSGGSGPLARRTRRLACHRGRSARRGHRRIRAAAARVWGAGDWEVGIAGRGRAEGHRARSARATERLLGRRGVTAVLALDAGAAGGGSGGGTTGPGRPAPRRRSRLALGRPGPGTAVRDVRRGRPRAGRAQHPYARGRDARRPPVGGRPVTGVAVLSPGRARARAGAAARCVPTRRSSRCPASAPRRFSGSTGSASRPRLRSSGVPAGRGARRAGGGDPAPVRGQPVLHAGDVPAQGGRRDPRRSSRRPAAAAPTALGSVHRDAHDRVGGGQGCRARGVGAGVRVRGRGDLRADRRGGDRASSRGRRTGARLRPRSLPGGAARRLSLDAAGRTPHRGGLRAAAVEPAAAYG